MNKEYILQELKKVNEVSIDLKYLYDISDFKTGKEESSMESLALILNEHSPIKNYSFDIKKLEFWCEENSLLFYLNERDKLLHLKIR